MEKSVIIGKRIECIIGFILLLPPILGAFAFILNLFTEDLCSFASLSNLSGNWTGNIERISSYNTKGYGVAGAMSAAPIFLGLMAIAGVYLVKDSFKYFFTKFDK